MSDSPPPGGRRLGDDDPLRRASRCLAFDGVAHRIICFDDRCGTGAVTLCGLRYGKDFDEDEYEGGSA